MGLIIVTLPHEFEDEKVEFLTGFIAQYLDSFGTDYSIQYHPNAEIEIEEIDDGKQT